MLPETKKYPVKPRSFMTVQRRDRLKVYPSMAWMIATKKSATPTELVRLYVQKYERENNLV